MPINCLSLLPDNWDQVGLDCSSLGIIEDAVELITESLCSINCELSRIAVTDDCSLLPEDFDTLYPECFEAPPDGALVVQVCPCNQGSLKIWGWDGADWVRIAKEVAIGVAGDFPTNGPSNPTAAELLALFGGHIADEAIVIVRPTGETWTTQNCGITWELLFDIPPIGVDVQQTTNQDYTQNGRETTPFLWYDEEIYTTGSSTAFPIDVGDMIDVTVVYGYYISQFADATNATDDATFRIRLSGAVADTTWFIGGASGNYPVVNGLTYATFNVKLKATIAANLRLRVSFCANGTTPSGANDWIFVTYIDRASVSVQRVDFV